MADEAAKREQALADYRAKLLQHKEVDAKVRQLRDQVGCSNTGLYVYTYQLLLQAVLASLLL